MLNPFTADINYHSDCNEKLTMDKQKQHTNKRANYRSREQAKFLSNIRNLCFWYSLKTLRI